MNKKIYALAALAAVALPAWAAEVYSSNIVGYQKLTLQPEFNMIPNSFVTVGDEELIPIKDMFSDDENATANRITDNADRIDTWDPINQIYVSYYRMTNRQGTSKWWGSETSPTTETDDPLPEIGAGAFYYNQSSEPITLTVSGQVMSSDAELTIYPEFNLLSNPFPVALPLNGEGIDWTRAVANRITDNADRIDTWDPINQIYVSYYRMTNRQNSSVWWGSETSPTTPTEDVIEPGQSFFYFSQAVESWTLSIPSPVK